MQDEIQQRFDELLKQGNALINCLARTSKGDMQYWIREQNFSVTQQWLRFRGKPPLCRCLFRKRFR
jgi:hypothetical protein